jgi:hypothetical protein
MHAMAEIDRDRRARIQALLDMDADADVRVDHVAEALLDPVGEEAPELLRARQRLGRQHDQRGDRHVDRLWAGAAIDEGESAIAVDQVFQRDQPRFASLPGLRDGKTRLAPELLDIGHLATSVAGHRPQRHEASRVVHDEVHQVGQGHGADQSAVDGRREA